ncbi:hypothetical protein EYF80_047007 [Liparis tanakae]|uniref:Uncharacterized protein n=1 Tax=Liparis tanakae TaxID=230148 RepID=A0A4Z2FNJ1_9TELE|nr:hypothetical protein EYF80_047007 [Liparis tanakae]
MPAAGRWNRAALHAGPRGVGKLWRDTAVPHGGPAHTSLAAECPSATHGRDSVPRWLNKITF